MLLSPIHCCDVTKPPYLLSGELCTSPLHSNRLFVYTVCCWRRGQCFSVLRTRHTDAVGDSSGRSYVTKQGHNVPLLRTHGLVGYHFPTFCQKLRSAFSRPRVRKSRYWGEMLLSPTHCCDVTKPPYLLCGELCTSPLHSNRLFVYTVCCRRRGKCFSVLRTRHTDVVGDNSGRSYVTQ